MFHGMKQKAFEDWVHVNVNAPFVFGVCQQGVSGLIRLRASPKPPTVKFPSQAAVEALAARWTASYKPYESNDMEEV